MSEFKGGEDVLFNEIEYVYIAKHPIFTNFSVIQFKGDMMLLGDIIYEATDSIKKKHKTHTVNGFEVPAPVSEEEFKGFQSEGDRKIFCFWPYSKSSFACFRSCLTNLEAIKCGVIFKSESDIKKNIAALQGIDPSTVG